MAQAAYKKQVWVSSNGTSWLQVEATSVSLNKGTEVLDATTFASAEGWRSRVMGIIDWSISLEAIFTPNDAALTAIRTANDSRATLYVRYFPDGTSTYGFQGQVVVESFNMSGDVSGLETVSISMPGNGALGDPS